MRRICTLLLVLTLPVGAPTPAHAEYDPKDDEAALKELKLSTDGPSLVQYFRNLILPKADKEKVLALIERMGDNDYDVREQASKDLRKLGPSIVPLLKLYVQSQDPEIAQRARECLLHVQKSSTEHLVSAAARLIGHRNPPEAVSVLFQYAPYVKDPSVEESFAQALQALVNQNGKTHPEILKAVDSKTEIVRRLAKQVLVESKAVDTETAKKYLDDTSPLAKLRVALALVHREEKSVMPTFINLLSEVPEANAWEVDTVLYQMAGDKAPENANLGTTKESRVKARDLWLTWWKDNEAKVDLADLKKRPPFRGWTLLTYQDNRNQGHVLEVDRNNKVRWELTGLRFPIDAQILPNGNVLAAEMYQSRISEWNVQTKKMVWQHQVNSPVAVQHLRNGQLMIANLQELIVMTKQNKNITMTYKARQPGQRSFSIYGARALPNGGFVIVNSRSEVIFMDAKGKETQKHAVAGINNYCTLDVLANGNVLIPVYSRSEVVELTPQGRKVWTASVRFPTGAFRLPNGNTLVASSTNRNVVELTKGAKPQTVGTPYSVQGTPWCARRR